MNIQLTEHEVLALAYLVRRQIETNRYLLAPQLEPLRTAFAKLAAGSSPPRLPKTPRRVRPR